MGGTTVIGDLAAIGYDAEWRVVSAASVGANHRRDRIFIVAYPNRQDEPNVAVYEKRLVAYAIGTGLQGAVGALKEKTSNRGFTGGSWWITEPDVGRVANGVPARVDRLRGLGNAVVPQVAEIIGRLVVAHAQNN